MNRKFLAPLVMTGLMMASAAPAAEALGVCIPGTPACLEVACLRQLIDCRPPPPPCQPRDNPQGEKQERDPDLCPPPARGASCISHGILVTERQLAAGGVPVGDATISLSRSVAKHETGFSFVGIPAARPLPLKDPAAHADAQQAGASYTNAALGIDLSASTVFSWCDAAAGESWQGFAAAAFGRGGVEDLRITVLGSPIIAAELLDYQMDVVGSFGAPTTSFAACDIVELDLLSPPPELMFCAAPNTVLGPVCPVAACATLVLNEEWGAVFDPFLGQWIYGGSVLHLQVVAPALNTQVDVYIGYVSVAAIGGFALPPVFVDPHVGP